MKKYLIFLIIFFIFFFTCKKDDDTDNDILAEYSEMIGPDGGTITTPYGKILEVPEGALNETVNITTILLTDVSSLHKLKDYIAVNFIGGVFFEPEGKAFSKPVEITIPVEVQLIPGSQQAVYYFDEQEKAWIETGIFGIVSPDGCSITAEVDHFCIWGAFNFPSELMMLEKFKDYFGIGDDPIGALNYYIEWFNSTIKPFNFRALVEGCCYAIRGYEFDILYKVNENEEELNRFVGESMPESYPDFWFIYDDSDESNISQDFLIINLKLYLGCKPDLTVKSEKSQLLVGETTTVTACLKCGDENIRGGIINLSSTSEGSLSDSRPTTSSSGEANVTLEAVENGTAIVTAMYEACKCEVPTEEYTATKNIHVGESQLWRGKLELTGGGCDPRVCISNFSATIDFELLLKIGQDNDDDEELTIINESHTISGFDVVPGFNSYINDYDQGSVDLWGIVYHTEGQFVFDMYVAGGFSFEYCWYLSPDSEEPICRDGYGCAIWDLEEEIVIPDNSTSVTTNGTFNFVCMQPLEGSNTYTISLNKITSD